MEIERNPSKLYPWQGVIQKLYTIGCAGCSFEDQGKFPDLKSAMRYWRQQGWHQQQSLWYCETCHPGRVANGPREPD